MTDEEKQKRISILESILFAYGEPLAVKKLGELMNLSEVALKELISEYHDKISNNPSSGLVLLRTETEIQLGARPENHPYLEKFLGQDTEEDLTPSSLEVLTIILYRAPISRPEIDFIRGVNSSYILRSLLMRGLVQREKSGLSFLYQPSFELLKLLGLANQKDLPEFETLNQRLVDLIKQTDNGEGQL
ncbi:MAG: Segregation and condensation protein B [Parcubacteria group bacterium GW2011_GWC1_45_9]|nr:MAG: Segregation and condensation protein B [Parcubacteria group bacterium GW2011_GWA1_Parcubacteria_45_10]KKT88603.1 MAG: Segregation and condensation protein B [Parcubacteria group bacterium GW2011_GWB1_45_10]KKU17043.1 MAG: Segregation and condensation protein B [Parcubacteria group bacterium GW2011_GWC1_45_9]HCI05228.1 hypothetical protein [Patescibacteria group bacterium]